MFNIRARSKQHIQENWISSVVICLEAYLIKSIQPLEHLGFLFWRKYIMRGYIIRWYSLKWISDDLYTLENHIWWGICSVINTYLIILAITTVHYFRTSCQISDMSDVLTEYTATNPDTETYVYYSPAISRNIRTWQPFSVLCVVKLKRKVC